MTQTVDQYRDGYLRSMPPGAAFTRRPDSVFGALFRALAFELTRVEGRRKDLQREADPYRTEELLEDWERVAGLPDPCFPVDQTLEERRLALVAKLAAIDTPTPSQIQALGIAQGLTVAVTEFEPARCGTARCGDPCSGFAWAHHFLVTIAGVPGPETDFECAVLAIKPAHATVRFEYQ